MNSVVIYDFDFMRPVRFPDETDAPLVIDADGVLAFPIAHESFESVAGWHGEAMVFGDGMKLGQFSQGDPLDIGRKDRVFRSSKNWVVFLQAKERIIRPRG